MDMKVIDLLKNKLPKEYVDAIINNLKSPSILYEEAGDIEGELLSLFDWTDSNEGHDFWSDVFESVTENKKLPKMNRAVIDYLPGTIIFTKSSIMTMNVAGMDIKLNFDYTPSIIEFMSESIEEKFYTWMN
jgi:hypothetical protein